MAVNFDLKFEALNQASFDLDFGVVQEVVVGADPYTGNYEVVPQVEAQTLTTKGMRMTEDITIREIPYYDVSNKTGGSTVYIAGVQWY